MTTYRAYKIERVEYQGCDNYRVRTPEGRIIEAIAANIKTAKRWIDQERSTMLLSLQNARNAPFRDERYIARMEKLCVE